VLAVVPFFVVTFIRFQNQPNFKIYEGKPISLPTYKLDNILRYVMIASPAYYIIDSLTLMYLWDRFDLC
jgi:hypothetical protein